MLTDSADQQPTSLDILNTAFGKMQKTQTGAQNPEANPAATPTLILPSPPAAAAGDATMLTALTPMEWTRAIVTQIPSHNAELVPEQRAQPSRGTPPRPRTRRAASVKSSASTQRSTRSTRSTRSQTRSVISSQTGRNALAQPAKVMKRTTKRALRSSRSIQGGPEVHALGV